MEKSISKPWSGWQVSSWLVNCLCTQTVAVDRSRKHGGVCVYTHIDIYIYIFICLYILEITNLHLYLQFSPTPCIHSSSFFPHICTSSPKIKSWFLLSYSYWFAQFFHMQPAHHPTELWCCSDVPSCEGPGSCRTTFLLCSTYSLCRAPVVILKTFRRPVWLE